MNKVNFILLFLLLFVFGCVKSKSKYSNTDKIIVNQNFRVNPDSVFLNSKEYPESSLLKIDIYYVEIEIETPFRITCKRFNNSFKEIKQFISITDKKTLSKFEKAVKDISIKTEPDTRIQLIIYYKKQHQDTICVDRFTLSDNPLLNKCLKGIGVIDLP